MVASLALGEGCAFVDLKVSPPPEQDMVQPSNLGRGRVVLLMPFADQRSMPQRCGMQKNGYNMDTASAYCEVPPPLWLSQALTQGLTSAGFRVVSSPAGQGASAVQIEGAVLQFFIEPDIGFMTVSPEADISVKLVVTSRSGLRAERTFYFKGIEVSLLSTEENFQRAANTATRQAVTEMVRAIASLLDRFPPLGLPEAGAAPSPAPVSMKEVAR